ncbi:hypothetical protein E2C01_007738 [Portunus trituberculatus]|uniref:Uncharacterized protein n=1 Tax=Portunus trituberculatus TaxID=210409 RepID=A0A5B7D012_PORTR|nr:hypothetical protein [Portunus trituberculatus]
MVDRDGFLAMPLRSPSGAGSAFIFSFSKNLSVAPNIISQKQQPTHTWSVISRWSMSRWKMPASCCVMRYLDDATMISSSWYQVTEGDGVTVTVENSMMVMI